MDTIQQQRLASALSPPERRDAPDPLPDDARAVLRGIMGAHARKMGALMTATLKLQYLRVESLAKQIAVEASIARPTSSYPHQLNSMLPEGFFRFQDQLRTAARAVGAAAHDRDAAALGRAYGTMSDACVRCHATFRSGGAASGTP